MAKQYTTSDTSASETGLLWEKLNNQREVLEKGAKLMLEKEKIEG